jgi:hypothetical protein
VFVALESGRQVPPGLAGGKTVVAVQTGALLEALVHLVGLARGDAGGERHLEDRACVLVDHDILGKGSHLRPIDCCITQLECHLEGNANAI